MLSNNQKYDIIHRAIIYYYCKECPNPKKNLFVEDCEEVLDFLSEIYMKGFKDGKFINK